MRLFVALGLSDEVRGRLAAAQAMLKRELARAEIRWQALEQSHLTLRFLGEVAERELPACRLAVSEAARRSEQFSLATGDFGAFPTHERPSVLWLGVSGDLEQLKRLQTKVSSGLEQLAPAKDGETFRPHLTLGRVKKLDRASRETFAQLMAGSQPPAAWWRVESIQLMASELRATGPRYTVLHDAALSG